MDDKPHKVLQPLDCTGHCDQDGVCDCDERWERYHNVYGGQPRNRTLGHRQGTIAILFSILLVGCANQFDGVYRAPDGSSRLTTCHWDKAPNNNDVIYCHDSDRGTW